MEKIDRGSVLEGLVHGCFLSFIAYPIWYYLDWRNAEMLLGLGEDRVRQARLMCGLIRAGVMFTMCAYIYAALQLTGSKKHQRTLLVTGSIAHLLTGLGIVAIIWQLRNFDGNYFAGLVMVFFLVSILTPWPLHLAAFHVGTLLVAYCCAAASWLVINKQEPSSQLLSNMVFIAGSAALCCYGSWKLQHLRDMITRFQDPSAVLQGGGTPARSSDPFQSSGGWEAARGFALVAVLVLALPILAIAAYGWWM